MSYSYNLKHFVKHIRPAVDHKVVLVMDNHESHESLASREYAKKNSIFIVTLPPHTSHRTQPLDRAVFGPMKTYMNSACDAWCLSNPGRAISIYNMADLIREAWLKASTPNNIISGFKVSEVWPFDKHAFDDLPSSVTDRPLPEPRSTSICMTTLHQIPFCQLLLHHLTLTQVHPTTLHQTQLCTCVQVLFRVRVHYSDPLLMSLDIQRLQHASKAQEEEREGEAWWLLRHLR